MSCVSCANSIESAILSVPGVSQSSVITPNKPGKYEFACGMNMLRGFIEVQGMKVTDKTTSLAQS